MAVTFKNSVLTLGAQGDSWPDWVKIDRVRLEGPSTAGHQAVLQDSDGNVIMTITADAADEDKDEAGPGWVKGVTAQTLDSGTVRIFDK